MIEDQNTFLDKAGLFLELVVYRLTQHKAALAKQKADSPDGLAPPRRTPARTRTSEEDLEGGQMFEVCVDDAARRSDPLGLVPQPIRTCCQWILDGGHVQEEGVFRIPGDLGRMRVMFGEWNRDFRWVPPRDEPVENVCSSIVHFLLKHRNKNGAKDYMWGKKGRKEAYYLGKKSAEEMVPATGALLNSFSPACRETLWVIVSVLVEICKPENCIVNKFGNPDPSEASRKVALCLFPDIMNLVQLMIDNYERLWAMTH